MKRFVILLLAALLSFQEESSAKDVDVVRILRLNTPSIVIGNSVKTIGSEFALNERIDWSNDNQAMYVQNLRTKEYLILTKEAFESKSVTSLDQYVLTCKASTRATTGVIKKAKNKNLYEGQKRIALIIGNSNYLFDPCLKNPVFDASTVATRLTDCGFDTYAYYDCTAREMKDVLSIFINRAINYDVALFYFAGHGLTWEQRSYYLPVDVELDTPKQLVDCLEGFDLMNRLKSERRSTLILLDACRTKKRTWARGSDDDASYQMEAPVNMSVIYSTTDGNFALDGDSDLSPFAEAFLYATNTPGISFAECAASINAYLYEKTGHIQNATQSNSLMKSLFFQPTSTVTTGDGLSNSPSKKSTSTNTGNNPNMDFTRTVGSAPPIVDATISRSVLTFKSADDQYAFGMKYYDGNGVKQDYKQAFFYLKPLADAGYAKAYFPVADMFHRGQGVKKDRFEAEKWYKKAAESGDSKAKRILYEKF